MSEDKLKRKIYYGGPIISMVDEYPLINSIGVDGEKIIATGDLEDVRKTMGEEYQLINLEGKALVPGFIDNY
ncbi:MAG: hypothetical protein ACXACO_18355 [Promethearchaeota archaeon]|jgi:predicted amidohydrolase YtcJ